MKKYRLIKEYPGSDSVGLVVSLKSPNGLYEGYQYNYYSKHVENQPEYWEEVVEKDYEIVAMTNSEGTIMYFKDGWCTKRNDTVCIHRTPSLGYILRNGINNNIHSVKRLSDGEVFTIGDLITGYWYIDARSIQTIKICIYTGSIRFEQSGGCTYLSFAKKAKQPIFLTHDGKDIFEGDKVWWVNKKTFCSDYFVPTPSVTFFSDINAYFLTEEEAEEYIKRNKVLFTTEDGVGIKKGYLLSYRYRSTHTISNTVVGFNNGVCDPFEAVFSTREAAEEYIKRNKVLFTTEDGVGIKKGDTYYLVDTDLSITLSNAHPGCGQYSERKYFSTFETAQYYVIVNAKVLSIEEFWEFVSKPGSNVVKQKALKRLVKERLNLK